MHSIVMPNYNEGTAVRQTLDSVLAQTYTDFELVIVDDCSSDESWEVLQEYARRDKRIRLFQNEKNSGVFPTTTRAVELSKGAKISFLSSGGDLLYPGFLEAAYSFFNHDPRIKIWTCHLDLFRGNERCNTQDASNLSTPIPQFFASHVIASQFRHTPLWIHGMATIIDREAFWKYGGFPLGLGPHADWYLFHKVALHEGLAYSPDYLAQMQLSDDSYSRRVHLARKKRNASYWDIIHHLFRERETLQLFLEAGLLTSISNTLFWKLIRKPKYWPLLKHSKSSTARRISRSLLKKMISKEAT